MCHYNACCKGACQCIILETTSDKLQNSIIGLDDGSDWGVLEYAASKHGADVISADSKVYKSAAAAAIVDEDQDCQLLATMGVMWNDLLALVSRDGMAKEDTNDLRSRNSRLDSGNSERASILMQSMGSVLRIVGFVDEALSTAWGCALSDLSSSFSYS